MNPTTRRIPATPELPMRSLMPSMTGGPSSFSLTPWTTTPWICRDSVRHLLALLAHRIGDVRTDSIPDVIDVPAADLTSSAGSTPD